MTTWVLLRGLTRERGHWGRFPALLGGRLGGAPVLALDLPGNGEFHRQPSPSRVEAFTDHALAQLHARGVPGPYVLVAMSLGAMVAIDWAGRAPGTVAGCVLVNTSMRPHDRWYRRLRPRNLPALLRLALPGPLGRERSVLAMTTHDPAVAAAVLPAWAALRRQRPVAPANALRQLLAAARFSPADRAPPVPLLVLASAQDRLVDARCSRGLATRWHADLALHPWAGHDLPLDDPDWVARQVADWAAARLAPPPAAPG